MRVLYPYNEILPGDIAHDLYIYNQCAALAREGVDMRLLVGMGTASDAELARFHGWEADPGLKVVRRPLLRRNRNWLRVTWTYPFHLLALLQIKRTKPDVVFSCAPKQARVLFRWKRPGTKYVYDLHEIAHYPTAPADPGIVETERQLCEQADLVTVTVEPLKRILKAPPYSLRTPVEVVPLAVRVRPLPEKTGFPERPKLIYVGSLFADQGVRRLLEATREVDGFDLEIVGGTLRQVDDLRRRIEQLGIADRVQFHGFRTPDEIHAIANRADAFLVPMDGSGRNPYTARQKVLEYALWGRPVILPDLEAMHEHLPGGKGALFFDPDRDESLREALRGILEVDRRRVLTEEVKSWAGEFSWEQRGRRLKAVLEGLRRGPA